MTPRFLAFLLLLFLGGFLLQITYWHLVRPVLLLKLRYQLFGVRDRLRIRMLKGEIGANQPAYRILEEMSNLFISSLPFMSLTSILICQRDQVALMRAQRDVEMIRDSTTALREIYSEISTIAMGACIANSPIWLPIIALWLITAHWSNNSRNKIDRWKQGAIGMTYATA